MSELLILDVSGGLEASFQEEAQKETDQQIRTVWGHRQGGNTHPGQGQPQCVQQVQERVRGWSADQWNVSVLFSAVKKLKKKQYFGINSGMERNTISTPLNVKG